MQRLFGIILLLVLVAALIGGCTEGSTTDQKAKPRSSETSTGTIEVRVTDAPPGYEITSVKVTVSEVEVHKAVAVQEQEQQQVGDGSDAIVEQDSDGDDGEWIALGILPGHETFDLLLIQDLEQVLATDEVEAGKYTQIRMAVTSVVVEYVDDSGTKTAEAELPSGKLKFVRPFDVEAGYTTALIFDFIAEKSVVFSGADKVIFKPVIKLDVSSPKPTPSPTLSPTPMEEASEPDESDEPSPTVTRIPDKTKRPGDIPQSSPGKTKGPGTPPADEASTGNLVISVTDAPPGYEITSVEVTVSSVEVHKAVAEQDRDQEQEQQQIHQDEQAQVQEQDRDREQDQQGKGNGQGNGKDKGITQTSGTPTPAPSDDDESDATVDDDGDSAGWIAIPVRPGSETFDLLNIQGIEQVLAEGALDPGKYTQIRMAVKSVVVEYKEGSETKTVNADVPSGKLKFVRPFSIEAGKTTTLLFDFIASKSVVFTGSGKVHFKPVIKLAVSEPVKTKTLRITTASLPCGIVGSAYSAKLKAIGGTTPYAWSATPAGTLPAWLSLNASTGALTGTPTAVGTYSFKIQVKDSSNPVQTVTKEFTIRVVNSLTITTASLPDGVVGDAYSVTLQAAGGTPAYAWSGTPAGTLPAWLNLNASTGVLSGTPTAVGTYTFTVQVKDSSNPVQSATKDFAINVVSSLTITTASLPDGVVGNAYSQTLQVAGGTPAYAWSATPAGTLPVWLNLNASTGALTGVPTAVGTYTFKIQVKDGSNPVQSVTKEFTIKVVSLLTMTTASLPGGVVGNAYSVTLQAAGGTPAYAWSATPAGTLPAWLSLNASTGALSGTPTAMGTYTFKVQVKDGSNPALTATKDFAIVVAEPLSITTTILPDGTVGSAYSQMVQATGGTTPFTWSISAGALPDGLTLDGATGAISGTPTTQGTTDFTVEVKDGSNPMLSASKSLSITVIVSPAP